MKHQPYIGDRSKRQNDIIEALWAAREYNSTMWISAYELGEITSCIGIERHIAPLRIKLRRLGWEIESSRKGYRIVVWKGDKL